MSDVIIMEFILSENLTRILIAVFLMCYLAWSILRDYRLVDHWEYKIWDMRRGQDLKGVEYEIARMEELGSDGWECYEVLQISNDEGIVQREYHFKRKRSVLMIGFKKPKTGTSTGVKVELK